MTLRDLKIGWRLLASEPVYSTVVIAGLSVGFAACFLLLSFVRYSWQYNEQVPDVANVYVVKQRFNIDSASPWFDQAPYLLRNAAMTMPGVVAATGYDPNTSYPVRIGNQLRTLQALPVLPGFAQMLGLEAVEGDLKSALEQPEDIVMTEQSAEKYFGTARALGLTIHTAGKTLRVAAILRNRPGNTTIPFESLIGLNSVLIDNEIGLAMLNGTGSRWGKLLIHVAPGTSISALTEALQQTADHASSVQGQEPEAKRRLGNRKVMDIKLSPLRDAYFDHDVAANPNTLPGERGNPMVVAGLAAIALLILALAAINYVNLATVRVLQRQREIGMRKVIGATAQQIIRQFLGEALLVALLATTLGMFIAWLALPVFSELMNRKLDSVFTVANIAAALLIGTLVGATTSVYPTWIALRVRPAQALVGRPNSESKRGNIVRRVMTVLQITAALTLASVTLAIAWQTHFAMNTSPGFDPTSLLIVDLPVRVNDSQQAREFIAALRHEPGIASVAITGDAVGRSKTRFGLDFSRKGEPSVFLDVKSVSANFFDQYRIRPISGRLFDSHIDKEDDPDPVILNEVAAHKFGFASPEAAIGQVLTYTRFDGGLVSKRIIGIAPELRFFSLHEAPHAIAWELWTRSSTLSIRALEPRSTAEQTIQKLWAANFPDDVLAMMSARSILAANYDDDARLAKLLAMSTGVAMAIAAFGLYALSAYSVQRRAREFVLRKLYGARRWDIALLVVREIGVLIVFAALIGLPIAAVAIQHYLSGYVEHAAIGYWTFVMATVAALLIALLAVARHTLAAMKMMPSAVLTN